MSIWDRMKSWFDQNTQHYLYTRIPSDRTDKKDKTYSDDPLEVYSSYFRLTLAGMALDKQVQWFQVWFPAAHTAVRLKYADYPPVELNHVTHVPQQALSKGIRRNYPITDLIPYNGGTVQLETGLLALKGQNHLQTAIKLLETFSGLVAGPLAQINTVATKVGSVMLDVFNGSNGKVQVAVHDTFDDTGGNPLREGYYAAILATRQQLDPARLSVKEDTLYYEGEELTGYDYLLLRIDATPDREDWRLQEIEKNLRAAKKAYVQRKPDEAEQYRTAALVAAFESPDLSEADRRRVTDAITHELDEVAERYAGRGAVAASDEDTEVDLNAIMKVRAMPLVKARALGPIRSLAEVAGGR